MPGSWYTLPSGVFPLIVVTVKRSKTGYVPVAVDAPGTPVFTGVLNTLAPSCHTVAVSGSAWLTITHVYGIVDTWLAVVASSSADQTWGVGVGLFEVVKPCAFSNDMSAAVEITLFAPGCHSVWSCGGTSSQRNWNWPCWA